MGRITDLLGIRYPLIQGGMVWCAGWRLASAVSEAGGLGLIGAGSMVPALLRENIQKCALATQKPFGVNLPLIYAHIEEQVKVILEEGVKIVFTSAGDPRKWTKILQQEGIIVVHVISSSTFALKAEDAGVHALVAEGFEAGGHNGREETTSLCLIPAVKAKTNLPLIAAGGIASGEAWFAATVLGAEGVQVGSRFAVCEESSAHDHFKQKVWQAKEGDTQLSLKKLQPVRLLKNAFYEQVKALEERGASAEDLVILLSKGRAKKGILEGDLEEGELEIGQVSAILKGPETVAYIVQDMVLGYRRSITNAYPVF